MKTKNLYYEIMIRRTNIIKVLILNFFLAIASWPRLLLEVFIRKSFGERYFSLSTAMILTFFLAIFPFAYQFVDYRYAATNLWEFLGKHLTWYLYLAAFVGTCLKRQREIAREPGVFDFAKYSLSNGKIDPRFYEIDLGLPATSRNISIVYEPLVFLSAGIILTLFHQMLGLLLIFSSIAYSLSYVASYHLGDEFVMDKIDEIICNEELVDSFVHNKRPDQTRGFEAYGKRPTDEAFRRQVVNSFFQSEPVEEVY